MIKQLLVLLMFIVSIHSARANAVLGTGYGFHSLFDEKSQLVTQSAGGPRACGPTALLYAFKFGNPVMKAAYAQFPGSTDSDKLKNIVKIFGKRPSKTTYHSVRLDPNNGMAPLDVHATVNDMLSARDGQPILQSQTLARETLESKPGAFLKRVHASLRTSILNKVPVVSIIVPYAGKFDGEKNTNVWSEHNGHYVVVTGVPDSLPEESLGFSFQYLDPETGRMDQAFLYEEVERTFLARKETGNGANQWIDNKVNFKNREVSSPYLTLTAPGLNLVPGKVRDAQRLVLTLATVIGKFENLTKQP
jgi:hypothetical protein